MITNLSPKNQLIQTMLSSVLARAIYVAADLGIADLLDQQPLDIATLSEKLRAHTPSLYRLMRMLTAHKYFELDSNDQYRLTPLGESLKSDALRDFILLEDDTRWRALGKLKSTIQNGTPAFDQIYGKSYFEYLASEPEMNVRFEAGMSSLTDEEDAMIASAIDARDSRIVVDIGGGRGSFVASVLRHHPHLEGILFELPHVVFPSENLLLNGAVNRCQIVSGSFFEKVPTGGDLYLLKRVLHDWDDHACVTILNNCREAMNRSGKIVIIDAIVPDDTNTAMIKDLDVYMMALFPGRERTKHEFETLFASAGFTMTGITPTKTELSIIEAIPE